MKNIYTQITIFILIISCVIFSLAFHKVRTENFALQKQIEQLKEEDKANQFAKLLNDKQVLKIICAK